MTRILLVEDDSALSDGLSCVLRRGGHAVDCVATGEHADQTLFAQGYDLTILDLALPGLDGFEVLRRLRGRQIRVPVLILTGRHAVNDRIRGLDLGADDYVLKPFEMVELEARVRALIRRAQTENELRVGRLTFDVRGRRAFVDANPIELSAREHAVLEVLVSRAGHVVSKNEMMENLYDWGADVGPNTIEVFVYRIRKKLQKADVAIHTVRGLGYLLKADDGPAAT